MPGNEQLQISPPPNCGPSSHSDLKCAIPIQLCWPLSHTDPQFDSLTHLSLIQFSLELVLNLYSFEKQIFFSLFLQKLKQTKNTPKCACN